MDTDFSVEKEGIAVYWNVISAGMATMSGSEWMQRGEEIVGYEDHCRCQQLNRD